MSPGIGRRIWKMDRLHQEKNKYELKRFSETLSTLQGKNKTTSHTVSDKECTRENNYRKSQTSVQPMFRLI